MTQGMAHGIAEAWNHPLAMILCITEPESFHEAARVLVQNEWKVVGASSLSAEGHAAAVHVLLSWWSQLDDPNIAIYFMVDIAKVLPEGNNLDRKLILLKAQIVEMIPGLSERQVEMLRRMKSWATGDSSERREIIAWEATTDRTILRTDASRAVDNVISISSPFLLSYCVGAIAQAKEPSDPGTRGSTYESILEKIRNEVNLMDWIPPAPGV